MVLFSNFFIEFTILPWSSQLMIIVMLRMIWFSICWIWCILRCLKLIKLISENLSNKPTIGQPSSLIIDIDLKWFGKLRLSVCGQKWFEILLRKFPCLGFWLTAHLSESHYGRCYDQVGERRRASPDFIGTLFSKSSLRLTPHSSLRVQITTAAPTLRRRSKRAGCSSIHRELSRRRWKGAAGPVVAPRVELFPSLSLCCESHLLAFNSMNESTNRENFMVWLDNGSTGIYAV